MNVPVPTVRCQFENDEAYYLIAKYIEGVSMSDLTEAQKITVTKEI